MLKYAKTVYFCSHRYIIHFFNRSVNKEKKILSEDSMLSVNLIYLGNEKEKYYNEAADEYIKRLRAFCTFNSKNLKDERLSLSPSESEISSALEKEGACILKAIPSKSYKIAMDFRVLAWDIVV